MAIIFDESRHLFMIGTENTSYIMAITAGKYLGHIYYGRKVNKPAGEAILRVKELAFVDRDFIGEKGSFGDGYPFEFGSAGIGDFRESCIEIMNENGQIGAEFIYRSHRIFDGKPGLKGLPATFANENDAQTLEITLMGEVLGIDLILSYSVFEGSDAIARHVRVVNNGGSTVYLNKINSACIELNNKDYEMLTMYGSWARERAISRTPIGYGRHSTFTTRGISSHQSHPFYAVLGKDTGEDSGEIYGMHFVYSGNFEGVVERTQHDELRMTMGINSYNFRWKMEPGEEFIAPEVITVYSCEGIGKMTRTLHDLYRTHLIRSKYLHKKRPILLNNWEATYFDFNMDKLLDIARCAKEQGIEMLVMDDGWFGKRNSDNCSLGDWKVNTEKLPEGIEGLVKRVNEIGLEFGIWFEPEMVSPDSDLYRAHPDYAIAIPGREAAQVRSQYVLDITRDEVRDYVYESVANILRSANIRYVKWDMNRPMTDVGSILYKGDTAGEFYHRYVLALYDLQERLTSEFPDLLLENCTSGGGRFDPGMLYYSPQIWASDDTDAIERLTIQRGTAMLYPLSSIGAHVSDCPNHIVGRSTSFETRGYVALAGTFGYELDVTRIPEDDRKMIPAQVAMYHKYNDLVREGDYYRIANICDTNEFDAWMVTSKDKKEALVTYIQVRGAANIRSRIITLKGLDPDAVYVLENSGEGDAPCKEFYGDELMNIGFVTDKIWGDGSGRLYHFTAK